jgi:RNA polymerase sigma-70 factor (ECF subfamily)
LGQDDCTARFVALTKPYHERLYRIAITICGDRDVAADLTQEALVRAFRAFDDFDSTRPILPWLTQILRNLHRDSFKTARSKHEVRQSEKQAEPTATVKTPEQALASKELQRLVQQELAKLDDDQRLVITLCDIEELSYAQAAEALEVPVGTVRSRLSRARQALRVRVKKALDEL